MMLNSFGTLYIVATPIGNLGDITFRAVDILKSVSLIAAEDTRHTRKLLSHYSISKELISYFEYSDKTKVNTIIRRLELGEDVALVSDAGTPAVSDPGRFLVACARQKGIPVEGVPGPCAAVNAYSIAGFNSKRFTFWGFLPDKQSEIKSELKVIAASEYPVILYVSPHKVFKTLLLFREELSENTTIIVLREMTKMHEQYISGTIDFCLEYFNNNEPKGEFVFIVSNSFEKKEISDEEIVLMIENELKKGGSIKEICRKISNTTGISKNRIYKISIDNK